MRRTDGDPTSVTLTSLQTERRDAPWISRYLLAGGAGVYPSAGASAPTPPGTRAWKGLGLLWRTPLGEASPSGMDPGLVLDSEAVKGPATRSPALGYNAERMNISQAVGHPSLGALHSDRTLTRMMPPRQRLLACMRSPMTPGSSNDGLPLQHQSFLEGSRLSQRGQDRHSCPPLHLERTHSEDGPATTGSPREGLSP